MYLKAFAISLLISFAVFITSCGGVKYIYMDDHDPWDDEDDLKVEQIEKKRDDKIKVKKLPNKNKVVEIEDEEIIEIPDIYEVSCNLPIEDAELQLRSELEERNYKIIKISYVTRGMKEQGRTDFWEDMRIYMICRLSDGYYILKHNPWLVGMCPMRIYTYRNKEGKLVIGMFRPSLAAKWMGNPDLKAYKVLQTYDKDFKETLDSICEE